MTKGESTIVVQQAFIVLLIPDRYSVNYCLQIQFWHSTDELLVNATEFCAVSEAFIFLTY